MIKRRFRQVNLATNAEIAGISSTALAERLFVDVDNDQLYYVAEDGTPTVILGAGSGVTNLGIANNTATALDVTSDTGTDATIPAAKTTTAGLLTASDKTKLDGIATGATANSSDAILLDRSNHTGTDEIADVNGLQTALDGKASSSHTHSILDVNFNGDFIPTSGGFDIGATSNRVNTLNVVSIDITGSIDGRDVSLDGAKLDTIEASAEVNNISDANATDLTDGGDSTLHYHLADRNRSNHTGTQTASTISDFDTEVSNNTSVTANTAKVSADGSINTHSDVSVSGITSGDILRYNGSSLVPLVIRRLLISNSSGITAITTTPKTLTLNNTIKTTGTGDFTIASSEVTIKNADDYEVFYNCALNDASTASRSSFTIWLDYYNGSTWSIVTGTNTRVYIRGTSDAQSASATTEITSVANGKVRLRVVRANGSGSAFQLTAYTSLLIKTKI